MILRTKINDFKWKIWKNLILRFCLIPHRCVMYYNFEGLQQGEKNDEICQVLIFCNAFDLNNGKKLYPTWKSQFGRKMSFWDALVVNFICRADKIIPDIYYSWSLHPSVGARQYPHSGYFLVITKVDTLQDKKSQCCNSL